MWAKFTDVINCAKFHLHWLTCFWAPGVRKSQFALCMGNRCYNSVRTNVLHYDLLVCVSVFLSIISLLFTLVTSFHVLYLCACLSTVTVVKQKLLLQQHK